jgi:hypothetical protein
LGYICTKKKKFKFAAGRSPQRPNGGSATGTTDGLTSCDPTSNVASQGVVDSRATCGLLGPVEPMPGVSLLVRHPRVINQSPLIMKKNSRNAAIATNAALAASHSAEKS